jgi:hypothetical protein
VEWVPWCRSAAQRTWRRRAARSQTRGTTHGVAGSMLHHGEVVGGRDRGKSRSGERRQVHRGLPVLWKTQGPTSVGVSDRPSATEASRVPALSRPISSVLARPALQAWTDLPALVHKLCQ